MTKKTKNKKQFSITPERLAELRRATLIASAGSSTRLEGSKLSDKDVERVFNIVSGQK
jgi:xanthine/CO dehydrogenase XdhC/CoxF family maturation factor